MLAIRFINLPNRSPIFLYVSLLVSAYVRMYSLEYECQHIKAQDWFVLRVKISPISQVYSYSSGRNNKTFKPKKNIPEGTHQYELMKHAEATLGSGDLRQAVMLPEGEDLNEWVAVNSTKSTYS